LHNHEMKSSKQLKNSTPWVVVLLLLVLVCLVCLVVGSGSDHHRQSHSISLGDGGGGGGGDDRRSSIVDGDGDGDGDGDVDVDVDVDVDDESASTSFKLIGDRKFMKDFLPPPFPSQWYCVRTVADNITGEVFYSGRYWRDEIKHRERQDVKLHGEVKTTIWKYETCQKFEMVSSLQSGIICSKYNLTKRDCMMEVINLNSSIYMGTEVVYGDLCHRWSVFNWTDGSWFNYFISINQRGTPWEMVTSDMIRINWLFGSDEPISDSDFNTPNDCYWNSEQEDKHNVVPKKKYHFQPKIFD